MASTSTKLNSDSLDAALGALPSAFRGRLTRAYLSVKTAQLEGRPELCGLRAAKFAETLLRYIQHSLSGSYTPFGTAISNFKRECDRLEQTPVSAGPESFRILIPRALAFLYTLRNKRDIGHTSGDIDANEIDALTAARLADWCVSELLRVTYSLPIEDAQALATVIAERRLPIIWSVLGRKRILSTGLNYPSQVLLLLYSDQSAGVALEDLAQWTEHPRIRDFRRAVIRSMHTHRLIEHDQDTDFVVISPLGIKRVEQELLPKLGITIT